jgi:hypothetical protein
MSRRTLAVLGGLAALAMLGVLVWAVVIPARRDAAAPAVAVIPAPPVDVTRPWAAPVPAAGSSAAPAAPTPAPAAKAEPFVQDFAQQPGVKPLKRLPSPTARLSMPVNVDGCDHAYGAPTQCIPWVFPAGTTEKCAWLAAHGFTAVKVVGKDRQKLDPDGNGIACD